MSSVSTGASTPPAEARPRSGDSSPYKLMENFTAELRKLPSIPRASGQTDKQSASASGSASHDGSGTMANSSSSSSGSANLSKNGTSSAGNPPNPSPLKRVMNLNDLIEKNRRIREGVEASAAASAAAVNEDEDSELSEDDTDLPSPVKASRAKQQSTEEWTYVTSLDFGEPAEKDDPDEEKKPTSKVISMKQVNIEDSKVSIHGRQTPSKPLVAGNPVAGPHPSNHPLRKIPLIPWAPNIPFDHSVSPSEAEKKGAVPTVKTTPRYPPPRLRPRMFELEECPTFYPTMEEFHDPLKYIEYISSPEGGNGREYGIVKIVPPEGWEPPFVLDQQKFRFRTRVQRLNSLSADARASLNFQEQLEKFHAQQGNKRFSVPVIANKTVDLYSLRLIVNRLGGYEEVERNGGWTEVTRQLGYDKNSANFLSQQVKAGYRKIILPFEEFLIEAKEQASRSHDHRHESAAAADASSPLSQELSDEDDEEADLASLAKRRKGRKSADSAKDSGAENGSGRRTRRSGERKVGLKTLPGAEGLLCEVCMSGEDGTSMLLCDDCNRGYHMYCLSPPLATIPKSEWYCPPCLLGTGHDFGFEDGQTHSLHSFWRRSEEFRKAWWKARPDHIYNPAVNKKSPSLDPDGDSWIGSKSPEAGLPNGVARMIPGTNLKLSEDDVEREFWRLVESVDEYVDVEYGADVHSTTHGSALPTMEKFPKDKYSRDQWNLNNLPILPASLLRYIKSDISGMTVPWIYVGMIFSTFCWHNEDHYTYSVNYQHFGYTKTWYGVPGDDAEKFEEAMRKAAPDLFETSPDLLFQLVTMMSPGKLKKEGVRVYACDQRPNEFVITYPKAYHAGFNQGFNLNEAVNFATPDWMPYGLESVQRYMKFNKSPVFSHDELIVTVAQHSQALTTALWLQHPMAEMIERELARRSMIRERYADLKEISEDFDRPETEYQCNHCSMYSYLAQVVTEGSSTVACLLHVEEVFGQVAKSKWRLRLRVTDDQLTTMKARLMERASVPGNWQQRLRKVLLHSGRPPLKTLRALLAEGERITPPLPEVEQLRDFVEKANEWVENASVFMPRKGRRGETVSGRQAGRNSAADQSGNTTVSQDKEPDRSPAALMALLAEVDQLPFDAPEISTLRNVIQRMTEIQRVTHGLLTRIKDSRVDDPSMQECEQMITMAGELSVDIPVIQELNQYISRKRWFEEMDEIFGNFINLEEVRDLLAEADKFGVPVDHHYIVDLKRRQRLGEEWEEQATKLLREADAVTIEALEALITTPNEVAVVPQLHVEAESLHQKAHDLARSADSLIKGRAGENVRLLSKSQLDSRLNEARRIVKTAAQSKLSIPSLELIQNALNECNQWLQDLTDALNRAFHASRPEPVSKSGSTIKVFCNQIEATAAPDDENVPADSVQGRHCVCRDKAAPQLTGDEGIQCSSCQSIYHQLCIKVGGRAKKLSSKWVCHICDPIKLRDLLPQRRAVNFEEVSSLVGKDWFGLNRFSVPPPEFTLLNSAVEKASRLGDHVRNVLATEPSVEQPSEKVLLQHLLRKALACPLNMMLTDKETVIEGIVSHLHPPGSLRALPAPGEPQTQEGDGTADVKKRKRGKRAKLVFREELGLADIDHDNPVYCLCHSGPMDMDMIECDRCTLWFHNKCVGIDGDPIESGDKYLCPMCSVKTEKRYPFAEVKVRDREYDEASDLYLDCRQTLRSENGPVVQPQQWAEGRMRITLHLHGFSPAIRIPDAEEPPAKKSRSDEASEVHVNGTQAPPAAPVNVAPKKIPSEEERHRMGMANLHSRGVSSEMINKWYIGWNGRTLIYPRYTTDGRVQHIELGPTISLLPHDRDGSIFMSTVLARQAEESTLKMQEILEAERARHKVAKMAAAAAGAGGVLAQVPSPVMSNPAPMPPPISNGPPKVAPHAPVAALAPSGSLEAVAGHARAKAPMDPVAGSPVHSVQTPSDQPRPFQEVPRPPAAVPGNSPPATASTSPTPQIDPTQARVMARMMKPRASEAEIDAMVASFLQGNAM